MKTTIDWLIHQSEIQGMYFLAGSTGSSHIIAGTNIIDNPDTVPWLKKNELVLSTGYFFTYADLHSHIIEDLHQRGCAGLGIKMNRYLDTLPSEMIEQANRLNFPIFSIPFNCTLEEIVKLIYYHIFQEDISETQRTTQFYKNIAQSALKKHSLHHLVENIGTAIRVPVFLTTNDFEIMEYYIPKHSSLSFPLSFSDGENTLFTGNTVLYLKNLKYDETVPIHEYKISDETQEYCFKIFPIYNAKILLGFLVCLDEIKDFISHNYNFIINVLPIIGVALINNHLYIDKQHANHSLFYSHIFSGELKTELEIELACLQNGFTYNKYRVCSVIHIPERKEMTLSKHRAFERKIYQYIDSVLNDLNLSYMYTVYNNDFIIFFFYEECPNQASVSSSTYQSVQLILTELLGHNIKADAGISQCYKGSITIKRCYIQAINALKLGRNLHSNETIFSFNKDYIYHTLTASLSEEQLREIYFEILGPLTTNEDYKIELCHTLLSYIDHHLNATQTAKALFIHRNTIQYRIEQIETILGVDLNNNDIIFQLRLAFYIKHLLYL